MIPDKALERSSSPKKSVACRGTKREGRKLTLTKKVVGDFLASTLAATRLSVKWRISNLNLSPHFFFLAILQAKKKEGAEIMDYTFLPFTQYDNIFFLASFLLLAHTGGK